MEETSIQNGAPRRLGLGLASDDMAEVFSDARSGRLTKLASESIADLFRDLGESGHHFSDAGIRSLRGLVEAVSEYFNVELHLLLEKKDPHRDAEGNHLSKIAGERCQRRDGGNQKPSPLICIHLL
jgi:hypothetical protein